MQYGKENGKIRITAMTTENSCRIDVLTAGVQIPEQHLAHLFERFIKLIAADIKSPNGWFGLGDCAVDYAVASGEVQVNNHPQGVVLV